MEKRTLWNGKIGAVKGTIRSQASSHAARPKQPKKIYSPALPFAYFMVYPFTEFTFTFLAKTMGTVIYPHLATEKMNVQRLRRELVCGTLNPQNIIIDYDKN